MAKELDIDYDIIDENELVEDTSIDRHSLDLHWQDQAAIHNKWSKRLRQALRLQEKHTTGYRLITAELFKRGRGGEFDLEGSMTDSAMKNWIESHPECVALLEKRNKYDALVNMLQGVLYTISQRRDALEQETKLFVSGYFAEPRIPTKAKEEVERETESELRKGLNKRMKGRGKKSI